MRNIRKRAIALGVASVVALGTAAPGIAGPVPSNTAALKNAVPTDVIEVRKRRWRRSAFPALVLGMFGAIAAAAAAEAYRERYYYPRPYAYAYPYPYPYPYAYPYHRRYRYYSPPID